MEQDLHPSNHVENIGNWWWTNEPMDFVGLWPISIFCRSNQSPPRLTKGKIQWEGDPPSWLGTVDQPRLVNGVFLLHIVTGHPWNPLVFTPLGQMWTSSQIGPVLIPTFSPLTPPGQDAWKEKSGAGWLLDRDHRDSRNGLRNWILITFDNPKLLHYYNLRSIIGIPTAHMDNPP